ncbi:MAG: bifunctional diaminohydroxyphosphoribosylaminopyrimidine deaminase/5-amino-6-(5-phosphoribosylamino)uracil reductase RibD, partial [Phycisphaerae bacterium]|nr:bifunctional diaminohydroxyphosphoribosylaminopyrimidine deaminase/5-amino-6-(5-phosphoribosylamino)uracil reductase RibD [Phycisphaerae bacterium]
MDPLTTQMRRALKLARRGEGYVEPNPMVGCVIVQDGKVVGEGWHRRFGGAHAEVVALRQAGPAARGATVVVTLEPCCRQGKTPPCTGALIEAGVGEVVIGCLDPTPEVDGRGVGELEAAGITTRMGPLHEEATRLVAPFIKRTLTGFPYVMLKWAATVDGAIATGSGDSKWISGEASRRRVHQWRSRVDAILVGIGTVLADDPSLTAR